MKKIITITVTVLFLAMGGMSIAGDNDMMDNKEDAMQNKEMMHDKDMIKDKELMRNNHCSDKNEKCLNEDHTMENNKMMKNDDMMDSGKKNGRRFNEQWRYDG